MCSLSKVPNRLSQKLLKRTSSYSRSSIKSSHQMVLKSATISTQIGPMEVRKRLYHNFLGLVLFVRLFNTLFDETYDLKLSTAESVDAKTSNWNKINAVICFNYLQQQFILIGSTMKALAQGKKHAAPKAIMCLLECTMGTQFEAYLDASTLKEIGTVMQFNVTFDKQDKVDLMTDDRLNRFDDGNGRD